MLPSSRNFNSLEQGVDRNSIIGILLISVILGIWMLFLAPKPEPELAANGQEEITDEQAAAEEQVAAEADSLTALTDPSCDRAALEETIAKLEETCSLSEPNSLARSTCNSNVDRLRRDLARCGQ